VRKHLHTRTLLTHYGGVFIDNNVEEVIVPSLWEQQTFIDKAGSEIVNQMWAFEDKKNRPVCLIPEVTGVIQEMWRDDWSKSKPKPYSIFYVNRCYRYERPQKGRYREFTQIGLEILGDTSGNDYDMAINLLQKCLDCFTIDYKLTETVQRGLAYYVDDGFEVECEKLGAQKQIAGGGRYNEGIGWAIGVDRLILGIDDD